MRNEQKQPQEGKPLTAEELLNEISTDTTTKGRVRWDDAIKAIEQYAAQQTAALRDDFRQMMERRDHWKKEAELLREELEVIKARNEGLEQEKQEYIDKYNLAISELEAVKKERDEAITRRDGQIRENDDLRKELSEVTRQRDEAVELLDAVEHEESDWKKERQELLSRLSSGEAKPVSPWISVEERLPKEGNWLVAYQYGVGEAKFVFGRFIFRRGEFIDVPGVTHWMPLPTPPKSSNQNDPGNDPAEK